MYPMIACQSRSSVQGSDRKLGGPVGRVQRDQRAGLGLHPSRRTLSTTTLLPGARSDAQSLPFPDPPAAALRGSSGRRFRGQGQPASDWLWEQPHSQCGPLRHSTVLVRPSCIPGSGRNGTGRPRVETVRSMSSDAYSAGRPGHAQGSGKAELDIRRCGSLFSASNFQGGATVWPAFGLLQPLMLQRYPPRWG